jgi:hypothetical protein
MDATKPRIGNALTEKIFDIRPVSFAKAATSRFDLPNCPVSASVKSADAEYAVRELTVNFFTSSDTPLTANRDFSMAAL